MTKQLLCRLLFIAFAGASLTVVSASSFASGSFSKSSSGSLQNSYNHGKSIFYKKIICKKCPLPKASVTMGVAKEVVAAMDSDKMLMNKLSDKERGAVTHYLKKRYKLN